MSNPNLFSTVHTIPVGMLILYSYGQALYNYLDGDLKDQPAAGRIYNASLPKLWWSDSSNLVEFQFFDSPTNKSLSTYSAYSDRKINVTYECESHIVTDNGDGHYQTNITVADGIGLVNVSSIENSTIFFTSGFYGCGSRCSVIEAFESSSEKDPWY